MSYWTDLPGWSSSDLEEERISPPSGVHSISSQEQEELPTAGPSTSVTLGLRYPGNPPISGHTMKEYEEKLSQLKKENYNLKLRIYFLKERMGHIGSTDDKEDPVTKIIELKVEAETLRKEVCDKQEQLCQAAEALDLMEEQHRGEMRKILDERDLEKGMLESRIQDLEAELRDPKFLQLDSTALISEAFGLNATSACVEQHTHEEVEKLQKHVETLEAQIQQLECILKEERVHSKQVEADMQEAQQESERMKVRCQGLELEIKQRDSKLEDLVLELEEKGQDLADCNLLIRTLEEALSAKELEMQIKVHDMLQVPKPSMLQMNSLLGNNFAAFRRENTLQV